MEALKRLRTTTKGRYTRGVNKLNRHIEEKRASLEEIELGDVRRLFDSVMNIILHMRNSQKTWKIVMLGWRK